jgi:hypothetical protein
MAQPISPARLKGSVELYAAEELDRRLARFFDLLAIHLVRGFEEAVRKPAAVRVATR